MVSMISFQLDGETVRCPPGLTVAGALFRQGCLAIRQTSSSAPRSLFCGMGVCFECAMTIDGRPSVRACVTPVKEGMVVTTQRGPADLGPGS